MAKKSTKTASAKAASAPSAPAAPASKAPGTEISAQPALDVEKSLDDEMKLD